MAVVTGANKGIGFEIVRQLAKEGITVVLTARDETRGKEALESLKSQELHNVNFHPLDVASQESILAFADWLRKTYGGIDILVSTFEAYTLLKTFCFCPVLSETFLSFNKINQTKLFVKAEPFVSDHKLLKIQLENWKLMSY